MTQRVLGLRALLAALVGLVPTLCAALVWAQAPGSDKEVVEKPEWSVGDWWELRGTDPTMWRLTVVGKEGGHYVLVRTAVGEPAHDALGKTRAYADAEGRVAKIVQPDGRVTNPGPATWIPGLIPSAGDTLGWVRFPLSVGRRWFFSTMATRSVQGGRANYAFDCKVERWETIEIGGRNVRALKVACVSHNLDVRGSPFTHDGWYAPEAKRLVRLVSHYVGGWTLEVTAWNVRSATPAPALASQPAPPGATPPPVTPPAAPSPPTPIGGAPKPSPPTPPSPTPPVAASPPADTEAPKIVLNYPPPEAKVEREQIVILGLVTDNVGIDRVQVTVNGVEVQQPGDIAVTHRGYPIRAPVALLLGENVIEVTATNRGGNVAQVVRTVTRGSVATPAPPAPKPGDWWAVVIGVRRYDNPSIPRLSYSVPDAEAIYQTLIGSAGVKKDRVLLLTDAMERKPTLRNIRSALGTFIARSAKKEDTVLIFFAGHGAPEVDPRGIERDGLAKYLVPIDADPDDLFSTALPMDDISSIFDRIEAERVVVLLDACYSGAAGGRTFVSRKTRAANVDDLFLERLTPSRGRAIITASRPVEVSIELAELGHGIFTYVVQGLKGTADLNRDGIVTVQELYEYAEQQVTQKSRSVGGNQHLVMKGELEGVFPLTKMSER